jgi:hypothetical protein
MYTKIPTYAELERAGIPKDTKFWYSETELPNSNQSPTLLKFA